MEDPNNQQQFAVSLKTDRDGFLRRRCPQCGRDFKTEINPADLQWELATQCRRMGVAVGDDSGDSEPAQLRCPYCAHVAPPSDMHTEETVDYLKRLINREIVIPQLNRFTSDLEDRFPAVDTPAECSQSQWNSKGAESRSGHDRSTVRSRPI